VAEIDLAICCASAPVIKPLILKYWPHSQSHVNTNPLSKRASTTLQSNPTFIPLSLQQIPYQDIEMQAAAAAASEKRESIITQPESVRLRDS